MAQRNEDSDREHGTTRSEYRLNLNQLDPLKKRQLQEEFGRRLVEYLQTLDDSEGAGAKNKQDILNEIGRKILGKELDIRVFDKLLKLLYADQYLRIGFRRLAERSQELEQKFSNLHVTVVAGASEETFAEAAAEDLILRMHSIGRAKTASRGRPEYLNVGIVSGSTTGAVVRAATDRKLSWSRDLGINLEGLPEVRVFALNVCLTEPKHLAGNSTLLAYQLAEKIKSESRGKMNAQPYGLSAPLVVRKDHLSMVDREPQTFEVVRHTEPFRVKEKLEKLGQDTSRLQRSTTELDIVLTGVGERPPVPPEGTTTSEERKPQDMSGGSIFFNLAKAFEFDMDSIVRENHVVGDVAFTAIRSDGEPVPLRKKAERNPAMNDEVPDGDVEYVFYSAVQLSVLEAMTKDKNKDVILVARHSEEKVPAIFASARHRYASRLVVDESTAEGLRRF